MFTPASFREHDAQLSIPTVQTAKQPSGDLQVSVTAPDADGVAKPLAQVQVWVDVDDFARDRG